MFDDVVRPSIRVGSRRAYVVPLSIVAHVLFIVAGALATFMAPAILPTPVSAIAPFLAGDVVLPPPPSPPRSGNAPRGAISHADAAPVEAPNAITPEATIDAAPPAPVGVVEGPGNISDALRQGVVAPPVPPAVKPEAPAVRVGGTIRPPTKIKDVAPVYPPIAQAAHIEGIVILETTIGTNGHVVDVKVLRSIPLLDDAARDAVHLWEFTPTLLNGTPVPVVMTVTVNFKLR